MVVFDLKREYPSLYRATTKKISHLTVPMMPYLAIDGIGNPTVSEFKDKSKLLFEMNKALKDHYFSMGINFCGSKLEGVWDTYDNSHFDVSRKKMIKYTLMMPQHPVLTPKIVDQLKQEQLSKTGDYFYLDVYLKEFEEGVCLQMLHIGPYNTEINTTKQIMEYITVGNLKLSGLHHEIYLNKPDKVAAEDLKTIIRYPIKEVI